MSLPPPRDPEGPYRVCLVCLGNICRSPMAEQVLRADLDRAGLTGEVVVDSAGTGDWHVGAGMDRRAAGILRVHGYPTEHKARQFDAAWFAERDLVLGMDTDNHEVLRRLAPDPADAEERLYLFRSFAPGASSRAEIPDPYYGGDDGFGAVLGMVQAASKGLTSEIAAVLGSR